MANRNENKTENGEIRNYYKMKMLSFVLIAVKCKIITK